MVAASTCQLSPHLVWASLAGRPGGCWRGRVLWFLCPCPCRCRGPCASVCVCVCSLAACSTRSLTQQHCQLFPLNTTPPCPPPRHLGKQSHPLMRSHMLMSRDVSGIPSFLPPPRPLCVASLWEHTHCGVWLRHEQNKVRGAEETGSEKWGEGSVGKGAEDGRRQGPRAWVVFLQEPGLCVICLRIPAP